ncbi:hypothetical protein [Paraburkholderia diazotrophica]|uniref:Uncharacterized protein n=1 Tax=Paraburkholderia diazotrophica TaxID=667676 RepID=A0A1H7E4P6_9BURK|nr:hypothetical protein [Paraburkholderia diazotrophica]SEK08919.1 hypothetical protein SAMN05192539_104252 [Paraburkholderia diazotrophica]
MNYPENSHAQERMHRDANKANAAYTPSYLLALREPTVSLAGNPNDRPDVATAAILGYN